MSLAVSRGYQRDVPIVSIQVPSFRDMCTVLGQVTCPVIRPPPASPAIVDRARLKSSLRIDSLSEHLTWRAIPVLNDHDSWSMKVRGLMINRSIVACQRLVSEGAQRQTPPLTSLCHLEEASSKTSERKTGITSSRISQVSISHTKSVDGVTAGSHTKRMITSLVAISGCIVFETGSVCPTGQTPQPIARYDALRLTDFAGTD
jgi:hypothetical protein